MRIPWVKQICQHCKREEKIYAVNMWKRLNQGTILYLNCYLGPLQVLAITSSEKTPRILMAQLLVGPRGHIHFLHLDILSKLLQVILLLLLLCKKTVP